MSPPMSNKYQGHTPGPVRVGDRVVMGGNHGVVTHNGRDSGGVYSRVRFDDGTEADFHRDFLAHESDSLAARVARLEAALESLADSIDAMGDRMPQGYALSHDVSNALGYARAALAEKP